MSNFSIGDPDMLADGIDVISIPVLNSILKEISVLRYGNTPKGWKLVQTNINYEINSDYGEQGSSNDIDRVYVTPEGYYLKINFGSDSYGYNEFIQKIQFVKPKETRVTVYE